MRVSDADGPKITRHQIGAAEDASGALQRLLGAVCVLEVPAWPSVLWMCKSSLISNYFDVDENKKKRINWWT